MVANQMFSFKLVLGVLLGLLVASIAVLAIISLRNNRALNETYLSMRKTHLVIDQAEEISGRYKDIQLESNAYFIAKDPVLVLQYREARRMLFVALRNIRALTSGNVQHQARIDSLESLLQDLTAFTDSVIVSGNQPYSEKALLHRVASNTVYRNNIRRLIGNIKADEHRLLLIQEKENRESIAAFQNTFILLLIGIAVLLASTFLLIRYNFNRRIRAQRELKKANELFSKLFHESPTGIVISQMDSGVITDCNNAYAKLVNYEREDIIGKTAISLGILQSEEREGITRHALESGIAMDVEAQLKPRDKDPIWASFSIQSIQVQNSKCLLFVILDMTTHKRAEEEIKKALAAEMELGRMKSNFISLASHEFRTPLTTILSSAFLLENYSFGQDREKAWKHLSRIKSSVKNLTTILDEFLSLTKIEEGRITPNVEHINLRAYIENICQSLSTFVKPGQHIYYNHVGDENAYTDPVLLANILNNLVSNAIKYSDANEAIYVSTVVNGKIQIVVKDSGIGIPDADLKNLFNRFYRGKNAVTIQGTGLGLHIMKHYVDMLKGTISVESQVGKGTEFKVTLANGGPV